MPLTWFPTVIYILHSPLPGAQQKFLCEAFFSREKSLEDRTRREENQQNSRRATLHEQCNAKLLGLDPLRC